LIGVIVPSIIRPSSWQLYCKNETTMGVDAPRVLIAEGDSTLRRQLYGALLDRDVFSDCVASANEALQKLAEEAYGVVIIDIALPGDVVPVIERIARLALGQRPVVLVLAGNPEAARSLDVEIVQIVLRKPVNVPQLVDVVRSCIHSTRARTKENAVSPHAPQA
jgi:DNA-binding response OmpR family regulator